jgi:hypothetical protein
MPIRASRYLHRIIQLAIGGGHCCGALNEGNPIEKAAKVQSRFLADVAEKLCTLCFEFFDFCFPETVKKNGFN